MKDAICENIRSTKGNALSTRNISLDVLRVLCMFLIVLGHAMVHGQVSEALHPNNINYYLVSILRTFLSVHVNCFVLISGYFLCMQKFKLNKLLSIWGQAFFWSITLYIILYISGIVSFDIKSFLKACLPFTQERYWFVTTYLLMYTLIPFLNAAIRAMSQRQYAFFLAMFFTIYIVLQNLFFWKKFTSTSSYDPLFFAFIYMIAAYFRLYPAKRDRIWYILCYFFICLFSSSYKIGIAWITNKMFGEVKGDNIFLSYSSVTMVIASACLFRFFEDLRITNKVVQKAVPLLSSLTFGVYLIHEQPEVRNFLWNKLLHPMNYAENPLLALYLLGIALLVFLSCALLEYLRQKASKILSINKFIKTTSNILSTIAMTLVEKAFQLSK